MLNQIFPKLTGPLKIGTTLYAWTDKSRSTYFSNNKQDGRELLTQIWYPSEIINPTTLNVQPYASDVMDLWKLGLKNSGYPEDNFVQLDSIKTYSLLNSPILKQQKPYPVIIFSHGYASLRSAYTAYYENLASHGYIVIGVAHTYYAMLTKFPDGRIIPADPMNSEQLNLIEDKDSKVQQNIWLQDTQFILDKLSFLNNKADSLFYQNLNLEMIGVVGHSFGGSTAIQLGRNEERIKACVNLDGALFGNDSTKPFNKPLMIIQGAQTIKNFVELSDEKIAEKINFPQKLVSTLRKKYFLDIPALFNKLTHNAYRLIIDSADHGAFSDWVLLKHLDLYLKNKHIFNLEKLTGSVDGFQMNETINKLLIIFFDKHLKNENTKEIENLNFSGVQVFRK